MIREMKKQARSLVFKNFKLFLLPVLLYSFSGFAASGSLYLFFHGEEIFKTSIFTGILLLGLFLIFGLCVSPLSVFLLFKAAVPLVNEKTRQDKQVVSPWLFKDIVKVVVIQLIPSLWHTMRSFLDSFTEQQNVSQRDEVVFSVIVFLLFISSEYLSYKFFACNYHYVLKRDSIKSTLAFSFKTMQNTFLKYIVLRSSFLLWYLLGIVLAVVFSNALHISDFYARLLLSTGCGVYLYVWPYEYTTNALFIKRLSASKRKQRSKRGV